MRKLPVNTDDWAGKYKGRTPANTDVNTFQNFVEDDFFRIEKQKELKNRVTPPRPLKPKIIGGSDREKEVFEMQRKKGEIPCQCITYPCNCGINSDTKKSGSGDPIKNKRWILYVLIGVGGYLVYKRLKK